MDTATISIIVPVYNVEKYLDRCVESIVNQTYKNLEIILVDDGSPDNCPAMCDAWAEKDRRIKVIHKENGGVSSARNIGLDNVKGEYVGFVDADDYCEVNQFQILFQNALKYNTDISICGYQINCETAVEDNTRDVAQIDALKRIATGDYKYGVLWNKLYKKETIKEIRMPQFVCCEDLVFNYWIFKNAERIAECDNKLYHYMQNEDSTVHGNFCIGAFDAVKSKEVIIDDVKGTVLEPYAIKGLILSSFIVLSGCIRNNMFEDEKNELIRTILCFKKEIMSSSMYSQKDKLKTRILSLSPKLFEKMILRKHDD